MPVYQNMDDPFQPVLNTAGFTFRDKNVLVEDWINCWNQQHPLLDIGCGNCVNSFAALESGAEVYSTEMVPETIETLKNQSSFSTLNFHHLRLPDVIPFPDEHFSGILCSEVIHFLEHHELIASIWELHRLLTPGGKVVLTCLSEDAEVFQDVKLKEKKEALRQAYPLCLESIDFISTVHELANMKEEGHEAKKAVKEITSHTPRRMNLFNAQQLSSAFDRMGFVVEQASQGPAEHYPLWEHGQHDQIRLIARKV